MPAHTILRSFAQPISQYDVTNAALFIGSLNLEATTLVFLLVLGS